ncbi:hypothetical protein ERS070178_01464, partial [Streptococcus pneumoniae]
MPTVVDVLSYAVGSTTFTICHLGKNVRVCRVRF